MPDKTGNTAVEVARLKLLIDSVEKAARGADLSIASYILEAVTKGRGYTYLHEKLGMPCGRDYFYARYRKFFWLLDKLWNPGLCSLSCRAKKSIHIIERKFE